MTNKKLKMAAMSVALTACVAASPLAANADAPEAAPEELKKEPVAEETKKEENTAEPQDNKQSEKAQETLKDAEVKYNKDNPTTNPDGSQKLDGVIVTNPEGGETNPNPNPEGGKTDPDPNPNPDSGETNPNPNPNPDSGETDPDPNPNPGSGETNPNPNPNPDSGETDPNPNPNPDSGKTDPNPNPDPEGGKTDPEEKKLEEKKPEEKEPEEKKPEQIGTAEKTEKSETTVETKPNPGAEPIVDTTTPPTVEKNPDGSTTITQPTVTPGKETTTTTGTGEATGNLYEKKEEVKQENIDLEKELGKVNPDISWDVAKDADVGNGYTVQEVENDGNQQTLKLRKEEKTTAEMTAEDIAKLVDAEKPTVNPDGTYTLTRTETILDAEGNPQTRTTYITIRDNKVTTKTTTELTITRKKAEQDGGAEVENKGVKYPSIKVTNEKNPEDTQTISPELLETILRGTPKDDGSYEYTDKDGQKYEVKVDETAEKLTTNAEIVARLKQDGYTEYDYDVADGAIYYTTPHGEKVKLEEVQSNLLRRSLTYKVTLTTTKEDGEGNVDKEKAEAEAKKAAIQNALTNAVEQLDVDNDTKAKLKGKIKPDELNLNGGTFEVTSEDGKTTYTLTYSDAGAEVTKTKKAEDSKVPGKDPKDITDVKDNTVTGTAYVTGSTIIWKGEDQNYDTGAGTLGIGADFKTAPEGATAVERDGLDRITSYKDAQGNTHSFKYKDGVDLNDLTPEEKTALEAAANKPGWTTENLTASLTRVRWEVVSPERKEPKTEDIVGASPIELVKDNNNWSQTDNNGTFDFTHSGTTYTGMKLESTSEDGKTRTYKKTDADNTVTIITVTTRELTEPEIRAKFGSNLISLNLEDKTVTYTGEDGKTYTASYVAQEEKLTVEVQKPDVVAATGSTETEAQNAFLDNLEKARLEAMAKGETLVIEYEENGEIKNLKVDRKMTWDEVVVVVGHVVNYNAMTNAELVEYLNALKTDAQNTGKYYDGSTSWSTPYYEDASGKMQRVPPEDVGKIYQKWNGKYYVKIDGEEHRVRYNKNNIKHLDLATDSKLTLSEKEKDGTAKIDDCVLLNPTLTWHENAETLVNKKGEGKQANFVDRITYDNEADDNDDTGHYEYPRASWDNKNAKNNAPTKSVFYKVEGKVAYGKLGGKYEATPTGGFWGDEYTEEDYARAEKRAKDALAAYQAAHPELKDAQVVEIHTDQTKGGGHHYYQIYLYQSDLTAYGYMSDDNNTCGNALFAPGSKHDYIGGYDLTLGDLTQIDKKHVVAKGKNTIALSATVKRKKLEERLNKELNYTPISKEWTDVTLSEVLRHGEDLSGEYRANYTKTVDYTDGQQKGIEGTGEDTYKSFTNLIQNIFKGDGKGTEDGGFIKYVYHSEKNPDGTPVQFEPVEMVVTTKQDAEVHYTFTSQESRDV